MDRYLPLDLLLQQGFIFADEKKQRIIIFEQYKLIDHIRKVYRTLCSIHIIENKFNIAKQLFNTFDDELNKLIAKYKETNNVLDAQQISLWAKMTLDAKLKYIKEKCNYEVILITARNVLGVYSHDTKLANKLICEQKRILDEECTEADAYYNEIAITYSH